MENKEKSKRGPAGDQPTGLIPNWEAPPQPCVSIQSPAADDASGKTPTPAHRQPVFVGAATSGRETMQLEAASAWQWAAKFANIPNESGHSSALKVCNADATLLKDALSIGTVCFFSF